MYDSGIESSVKAVTRSAGFKFIFDASWGSASLHPRLYDAASYRRLKKPFEYVQTFRKILTLLF